MFLLKLAGGVVGAFLLGYVVGGFAANDRATVRELRTTIEIMKRDAVQAASDAKMLNQYRSNIEELRNELSEKSRICFDGADTERLRDLWKLPEPKL